MIVSHRHRYIFLKTRKTAGTSIEIALSKSCGPDDIITPIVEEDERRAMGGRTAQNYHFPLRRYTPRDWARLILRGRRRQGVNHMTAEAVRQMVGKKVWDEYFIFTVDRNPWDAAISMWQWATKEKPATFAEFIASERSRYLGKNFRIYSIDDESVADVVVRYEHLADDLETVRQRVGIPDPLELPRAKGGVRSEKRHYHDVLTPEEAAEVTARSQGTIRTLGYTY